MVDNKTTNGAVMSQVSKVLDQKLTPLSRKFSELIPSVSNKCSPFSKKFLYRKNPKPAIGRKISSFHHELVKIDPRPENFICRKGVRDTILESSITKEHSKTSGNVQNKGIVNKSGDYGNAGQRSHNQSGTSIPKQYSAGKKGWGKSPLYKLKSSQQVYSIQAFQNGLHCLKYVLKENDFLCKIDLTHTINKLWKR